MYSSSYLNFYLVRVFISSNKVLVNTMNYSNVYATRMQKFKSYPYQVQDLSIHLITLYHENIVGVASGINFFHLTLSAFSLVYNFSNSPLRPTYFQGNN